MELNDSVSKVKALRWVVLDKKRGETPLEVLSTWKSAHSEYAEIPASYAGRLDPMAEGKLLVLLGEECKRQDAYTKLDKEYEIEVLLDFKTDTGDVLGLPKYDGKNTIPRPPLLRTVLTHEEGKHSRKYPIFSSKTVNGKPLFLYALEGKLGEIQIPEHIETMYRVKYQGSHQLNSTQLNQRMEELLAHVPRSDEPSKLLGADFRQDEIRAKWNEIFTSLPERNFTILKLCVTCGSGAYMRTLAERIGASFGTTALALTINRTKIGKYVPIGPVGYWTKLYK
jgi:tRNA U55 pseudouridine synthase TruB